MTVEAAILAAGRWAPAQWHADARGMDFNGSSYCFVRPSDFPSPGSRELASPSNVLTQLVSPGSPVVIPATFFGIHSFLVSTGATTFPPGFFTRWLRSHDANIAWADLQPISKGAAINWTNMDRWVAAAEAMGAAPIYTVMITPTWASSNPTQISGYNLGGAAPPTNLADLTDFVAQVATRYGSRILHWEVRNETNILATAERGFFWSGTNQQLADECKALNQTIKAIIPAAKILGPSTVGWGTLGGANDPTVYTPAMLTQAVSGGGSVLKDWIDIMSCHLYYLRAAPSLIPLMVTRVRAAMATAGIAAMPLFDTESGILDVQFTTGYPDDSYLKNMLRHTVLVASQGLIGSAWYAYDGQADKFGFMQRGASVGAQYQALVQDLSGATINSLVQVNDGTLVGSYTTAGGVSRTLLL